MNVLEVSQDGSWNRWIFIMSSPSAVNKNGGGGEHEEGGGGKGQASTLLCVVRWRFEFIFTLTPRE